MTINLDDMSLDDLKQLRKDIDKRINTYEQRQKADAKRELEDHAKKLGFKLEELVSDKTTKTKKPVPPKYRHPENDALTWSGRGRKPKWIIEFLDTGGKLDYLLIK